MRLSFTATLLSLATLALQIHAQACTTTCVRREFRTLSTDERARYFRALGTLMSNGKYDQFAAWHIAARQTAHGQPIFFTWHRAMLAQLEKALQAIDPTVCLHYWAWDVDSQAPEAAAVWALDAYGSTTAPGSCVQLPWMPSGFQAANPTRHCLTRDWAPGRNLGAFSSPELLNNLITRSTSYDEFRQQFEGSPHAQLHVAVGGDMATMGSPNDPIFYAHHVNVDRWYAQWQAAKPALARTFPQSLSTSLSPFPYTVEQVLDTSALCYSYEALTAQGTGSGTVTLRRRQEAMLDNTVFTDIDGTHDSSVTFGSITDLGDLDLPFNFANGQDSIVWFSKGSDMENLDAMDDTSGFVNEISFDNDLTIPSESPDSFVPPARLRRRQEEGAIPDPSDTDNVQDQQVTSQDDEDPNSLIIPANTPLADQTVIRDHTALYGPNNRLNLRALRYPTPITSAYIRMMRFSETQIRAYELQTRNRVDLLNRVPGYASPVSLCRRADLVNYIVERNVAFRGHFYVDIPIKGEVVVPFTSADTVLADVIRVAPEAVQGSTEVKQQVVEVVGAWSGDVNSVANFEAAAMNGPAAVVVVPPPQPQTNTTTTMPTSQNGSSATNTMSDARSGKSGNTVWIGMLLVSAAIQAL